MKNFLGLLAKICLMTASLMAASRAGTAAQNHYSGYQNQSAHPGTELPPTRTEKETIVQELGTIGPLALGLALLVWPFRLWDFRTTSMNARREGVDSSSRCTCRNWDPRF